MSNKFKISLIGIILLFIFLISQYLIYHNTLNILEVSIHRLEQDIELNEEQLLNIKKELKENILEYTNYEHDSTKLVVENLDPFIVGNLYPDLKSSHMYNNFNSQYLKLMRNIKDSKNKYNDLVETYNKDLVTIKGKLLAPTRSLKEYKK